jgi:hypothetical protein
MGGYQVCLRLESLVTQTSIDESGNQTYTHVIKSKIPVEVSRPLLDMVLFGSGPRYEATYYVTSSEYDITYTVTDVDGTTLDSGGWNVIAASSGSDMYD